MRLNPSTISHTTRRSEITLDPAYFGHRDFDCRLPKKIANLKVGRGSLLVGKITCEDRISGLVAQRQLLDLIPIDVEDFFRVERIGGRDGGDL